MAQGLNEQALEYHEREPAGKLEIAATKPMATREDLALAYSPGVAAPCLAIAEDPAAAARYTARANLVAVVSNGTAVLGLGAIGALASKPVMEGKAVLFKRFSGIDVFDIEVEERDIDRFCDIVAGLEPTFGGINLEDISAPACFEIEKRLRERMRIPVFHDDQHGTAIVTAAAITSGLAVAGKDLASCRLVATGAGAAALACLDLLVTMGLPREQIVVIDRDGVVYQGRSTSMDPYKARFATADSCRTLDDAIEGADIFLGLSGPNVLSGTQCQAMAERPLILALANPEPEIRPEEARRARPDAIICTGRSDYPNQVNNVLCFPFIFRGALDVGATEINEAMKIACAQALSGLAQAEPSDVVQKAYTGESLRFGPDYLLPKPFDPRLITEVVPAVAAAAMDSGVATRPIEDMDAYRRRLSRVVYKSTALMDPLVERARDDPRRVVYAEGTEDRVLEAAQAVVDAGLARPILVGDHAVIEQRIGELGIRLRVGTDVEIADPATHERVDDYAELYYELMGRRGASRARSQQIARTRRTAFAALMLRSGDADALLCGTVGPIRDHLRRIREVIGLQPGVTDLSALVAMIMPRKTLFLCDTHVMLEPTAEELAAMAVLSAQEVRRFGIEPAVAFLSHSNFGTMDDPDARRVRQAVQRLRELDPSLEADGEIHGDAAVSTVLRDLAFDRSDLSGEANLLVMPNLDAAHIAYSLLKVLGGGVSVGPMLLGAALPANVLTQTATVRGLVNMTAYAVCQAQRRAGEP